MTSVGINESDMAKVWKCAPIIINIFWGYVTHLLSSIPRPKKSDVEKSENVQSPMNELMPILSKYSAYNNDKCREISQIIDDISAI